MSVLTSLLIFLFKFWNETLGICRDNIDHLICFWFNPYTLQISHICHAVCPRSLVNFHNILTKKKNWTRLLGYTVVKREIKMFYYKIQGIMYVQEVVTHFMYVAYYVKWVTTSLTYSTVCPRRFVFKHWFFVFVDLCNWGILQ